MCKWLAVPLLAASLFAQTDARIDIDATKAVHDVPRTIFGGFLEPMRTGVQGGLWAQILDNPSLEGNLWSPVAIAHIIEGRPELARSSSTGLPLPWESLHPRQGSRFEQRWGDAANSSRSLLIMARPASETGVRPRAVNGNGDGSHSAHLRPVRATR